MRPVSKTKVASCSTHEPDTKKLAKLKTTRKKIHYKQVETKLEENMIKLKIVKIREENIRSDRASQMITYDRHSYLDQNVAYHTI